MRWIRSRRRRVELLAAVAHALGERIGSHR
jgi:hypothetical protein